METKEEAAEEARKNWEIARSWESCGQYEKAEAAYNRAVEAEKRRDSWLYRTFGW